MHGWYDHDIDDFSITLLPRGLHKPKSGTESCDELQSSDEDDEPGMTNRQYCVFWSSLIQLFELIRCVVCGQMATTVRKTVCGTMLRVYLVCRVCNSEMKWASQPSLPNGAPTGNMMLSTAILTTGALPSKVLRVLRHMSVAVYNSSTYFRHQREMVMPAIHRVWLDHQRWLIASLQAEQRPLVFGGDGRSDSPGHSAKFGSYVLMELESNAIIDIQLVQVGLSYHSHTQSRHCNACITHMHSHAIVIQIELSCHSQPDTESSHCNACITHMLIHTIVTMWCRLNCQTFHVLSHAIVFLLHIDGSNAQTSGKINSIYIYIYCWIVDKTVPSPVCWCRNIDDRYCEVIQTW